jgi:tetratricopeptide (TPR) repeat protein
MNVQTDQHPARPASHSKSGPLWTLSLGLALLFVTAAAIPQAVAQDPNDFEAQAKGLQKQVVQLEDRYLKPALLRSRYKVETRFNDAKVAYLMGDYTRASILFVGLVDNERAQQFDSYPEALYLLGDSLYQQRNFLAARQYFQKIITDSRGRFEEKAIMKLLEIAAKTGNYEGVDELYTSLDAQTELSPAVNYVRGKTLYKQKRHADARRYFQKAARDPGFALRANYFRGVAFAAEGQLDNAKQVFEDLLANHKPSTPEELELIDLTYLALGRITYENEDYEQAIDHYQHLERTSDHFDQMLYELTWTFIAQEKYKAASRVVDVFLYLSNPDPTFVPKVKLLRADLQLRLERYETAKDSYQDVVDTFTPVEQELEAFVADTRDLETFFHELVEAQVRGERPDYMPQLVQDWIDGSDVLDKAKLTVADLSSVRADIEASYSALEQMEARLESGARVESFPKLAEGMALAVELESRLVSLRQDMIEAQYSLVSSTMSAAEKQQWTALDERVERLRKKYDAMPKTRAEVRQRAKRIDERFDKLRGELDQVTFEIDAQQEQLAAIDNYISKNDFNAEQRKNIDGKKAEARKSIATLRKLQAQLRRQVEVTRQRLGMGDKVMTKEQSVRREYREMLAQQREFLEGVQGRSQPGSGASLESLQAARQMLPSIESRLKGFFTRMNELADERSDELRQDLASERKMLAHLDQEVARLLGDSKTVTAMVAYNGFRRVKSDFDNIIMRGDIGLIDVAWQKKEDTTREINQLFEDRTAELKTLQEAFEEVR